MSKFVSCVSRQFATEKIFPQFLSFIFPQLFAGGIFLHLSMEWTPLQSTIYMHIGEAIERCPLQQKLGTDCSHQM